MIGLRICPYMATSSKVPAIPPLFKADTATLTFSKQANGQVRVVYAGWDDNKVVLEGQVFEVPLGVEGNA